MWSSSVSLCSRVVAIGWSLSLVLLGLFSAFATSSIIATAPGAHTRGRSTHTGSSVQPTAHARHSRSRSSVATQRTSSSYPHGSTNSGPVRVRAVCNEVKAGLEMELANANEKCLWKYGSHWIPVDMQIPNKPGTYTFQIVAEDYCKIEFVMPPVRHDEIALVFPAMLQRWHEIKTELQTRPLSQVLGGHDEVFDPFRYNPTKGVSFQTNVGVPLSSFTDQRIGRPGTSTGPFFYAQLGADELGLHNLLDRMAAEEAAARSAKPPRPVNKDTHPLLIKADFVHDPLLEDYYRSWNDKGPIRALTGKPIPAFQCPVRMQVGDTVHEYPPAVGVVIEVRRMTNNINDGWKRCMGVVGRGGDCETAASQFAFDVQYAWTIDVDVPQTRQLQGRKRLAV